MIWKVCVDTTFIIDLLHSKAEATLKLQELEEARAELLISTLSIFEAYVGCFLRPKQQHFDSMKAILSTVRIVPLDSRTAFRAAEVQATLTRQGLPNAVIDLLIGATALQEDAIMVTRNSDDFKNIPGLVVDAY
ncbi:MAG: type II toxin-antitoxin system VapC family toxin [Candidatus Hodarchaeales archaeon]